MCSFVRVCVGVETEDFFFFICVRLKSPRRLSTPTQDVTHTVAPLVFDYFLSLSLITLACGFYSGPERSSGTMTVKVGCFDNKVPSISSVGGLKCCCSRMK